MSAVPNALSALRALLALPLVWALVAGDQTAALLVFAVAVASDVLDGRVARRLGRAGAVAADREDHDRARRRGGFVDVGADAVFLLAGLTAVWALGDLPGWVPLVAVAMLVRFFATSTSTALVYDPIGRHYGSLLYAILGVWIVGAPPGVHRAMLIAVVVATGLSLLGRTLSLRHREGVTT